MSKLTKHELRDPDQIWKASRSVYTWMRHSVSRFLWFVGLGFVGVVGVLFYLQVAEKTEGRAQAHLAKAKSSFETYVNAQGEASQKALEEMKRELDILQKEFKSSSAYGLSQGLRAQWALKEKRSEEAIGYLRDFEKALPSRQKDLARVPLAVAFEDAGRWDEALGVYKQMATSKEVYFGRLALMGEARALRKLNRSSEAVARYTQFLDKYPSSPEALLVKGLLAEMQTP